MSDVLNKEDFQEPCCPFAKPNERMTVPVDRILEKLDSFLYRNDYSGAERHLINWLVEAETYGDERGQLTILNELIGLYRKLGQKEDGLVTIHKAFATLRSLGMDGSITMATTYINIATAYRSYDMAKEALPLYEQAKTIYESALSPSDARIAGLYNNMALTLMALGELEKTETMFQKALSVLQLTEKNEPEMAITYCNLADLAAAKYGTEDGEEEIGVCLDKAEELLLHSSLQEDGNLAFVCEKCAPTFGYYGYFLTESELLKKAESIYERNRAF